MWPLYVVIGLVEILVIFLVFRFMIEKMDLKTPGREEDETVTDLQENAASVKNEMKRRQKGSLNTASGEDPLERGRKIVKALGGKDNILSLENCFTRLRVEVADESRINEQELKETGSAGIMRKGKDIQVVYGLEISKVRALVDDAMEHR